MATRRASRKRHATRRFSARGRRLSARTRAAVVRLPRTHRGAGFRPFARAWRPKNPLSPDARELLKWKRALRAHPEPASWGGGMWRMHLRDQVSHFTKALRASGRKRPAQLSYTARELLALSRELRKMKSWRGFGVDMKRRDIMDGILRRKRTLAKRPRICMNPVLQAILPAIAQGAATGLGFAAANRLVGAANPRRSNGRHGVERTTRARRPSQRLSGAKIVPEAQYMHIPEVRDALRAHQEFHGHNPIHLTRVRVADGSAKVTRRYGFVIGEAPEVAYNVWKHAKSNKRGQKGKKLIWVHKFGEGGGKRPLLIHEPKTGLTSYLGGSYRVTDWFHK